MQQSLLLYACMICVRIDSFVHSLSRKYYAFTQSSSRTSFLHKNNRLLSPFLGRTMSHSFNNQLLHAVKEDATEEQESSVYWCPEQQIYVGGVPGENAAIDR